MNARPRIHTVLFGWHADRRSDAAHESFYGPLTRYFEFIEHRVDWYEDLDYRWLEESELPVVFFYKSPPLIYRPLTQPVIWAPMWDTARTFSKAFWASLPRNIRILSYCHALSERTRAAGLDTLDVRFFGNPEAQPEAQWNGERVAFYWNRIGLVSPHFLECWCNALQIDRLLFKGQMDPGIPQRLAFELPHKLGRTRVETIPHMENREDYFRLIQSANIFLAPRPYEGIGMTFIEALARGCAVFAYDGATMNEYVRHSETGYLLRGRASLPIRAIALGRRKLAKYGFRDPKTLFYLDDQQPWDEMSRLDLPAMGHAARSAHIEGYARWQAAIPEMVQFIRQGVSSK